MAIFELSVDWLDKLVLDAIRSSTAPNRPACQVAVDRAIEACYDAGELELASMLLLCSAARIQLRTHQVHQMLMQDAVDHRHVPPLGAAPNG